MSAQDAMARIGKWKLARRAVVSALVIAGVYGFWLEPSSLRVRHYTITLGGQARVTDAPLRVAVITDLHAGAPYITRAKLDQIVARTNAAQPDLILLAGDYVIHRVLGGSKIPLTETAAHLAGLRARLGVFAVLGNHDNRDGPLASARALHAAGITVLDDAAVRLRHGGRDLYLVGLSDYATGKRHFVAALAQVPNGAPAICFTHSPDLFPLLPAGCGLTIAGHTHGGQVWLPLVGALRVPSDYGQRYAAGHIVENGRHLFVSTGIGTSMLPVRVFVPPEVSVLDIR